MPELKEIDVQGNGTFIWYKGGDDPPLDKQRALVVIRDHETGEIFVADDETAFWSAAQGAWYWVVSGHEIANHVVGYLPTYPIRDFVDRTFVQQSGDYTTCPVR